MTNRPTDRLREKYFARGGESIWAPEQFDENTQNHDDDDVLAIADDAAGPLLPIEQVDAICRKIEPHKWGIYRKDGLIFHFEVIEPVQHAGLRLKMYVQNKPEWKKRPMPRTAKLYDCASVALGHRATRRDRIIHALWLNRLFRCEIRSAKSTDGKFYSVIHRLVERRA